MSKYILIADDNDGILEILNTYVTKEGFSPIIAHDGDEACDDAQKRRVYRLP